jgi:hypothetical protein
VNETCVKGVQQNFGFFELYPSQPNVAENFNNFPVSAGDSMAASVYQASTGAWVTVPGIQ